MKIDSPTRYIRRIMPKNKYDYVQQAGKNDMGLPVGMLRAARMEEPRGMGREEETTFLARSSAG